MAQTMVCYKLSYNFRISEDLISRFYLSVRGMLLLQKIHIICGVMQLITFYHVLPVKSCYHILPVFTAGKVNFKNSDPYTYSSYFKH